MRVDDVQGGKVSQMGEWTGLRRVARAILADCKQNRRSIQGLGPLRWEMVKVEISKIHGQHDLYLSLSSLNSIVGFVESVLFTVMKI